MSLAKGFKAEALAQDYLIKQGLKLKACNYKSRFGEIDLIMQDGVYLVFIEVRSRSSNLYGGAVASITFNKQMKIKKTASIYLAVNKLHEKYPARFDVISLQGIPPKIEWIKNAFQ